MDPMADTNGPSVEDRVARLERLLESTMQQVGFLTSVLADLVVENEDQPQPVQQPGVIIPMRR